MENTVDDSSVDSIQLRKKPMSLKIHQYKNNKKKRKNQKDVSEHPRTVMQVENL